MVIIEKQNMMKPDVVLVTKNVMVPLALPPSANKISIETSGMKKKTKIVKMRKNKPSESQTLSFFHNDNYERSKFQKKKEHLQSESEGSWNGFYINKYADNCQSFQNQLKLEKKIEEIENLHDLEKTRNFKTESDARYKIPFNHECINTQDTSWRTSGKQLVSSLSLPAADIPKLIHKLSHDTISLPNLTKSLKMSKKSVEVEKGSVPKISQQESIEEDYKTITNSKSLDKTFPLKRNSSVEINTCLLSSINSKNYVSPDSLPDGHENNNKCRIKYSWEDLENWVPPSQKKNPKIIEKKSELFVEVKEDKNLDCRIKYSWQIIGTGVQTSEDLIQGLLTKEKEEKENYPCAVKYSWQIIGTGTQVSFRENAKDPSKYERDYWDGKILEETKKSQDLKTKIEVSRKCKIFYNQQSQTTSDKYLQADTSNCEVKYSWQNLTKPYLQVPKNL